MSTPIFSIRVQGTGLDIDQIEKHAKEVVDQELLNCGNYILAELQKATPVGATGQLRRGWFVSKVGERIVISNPHEYLLPLELGRRASPVSQRGIISLELWVRRKLGVPAKDARRVAFLIARKKSREDTKGTFFVKKTLDRTLPRVLSYLLGPVVASRISGSLPPSEGTGSL